MTPETVMSRVLGVDPGAIDDSTSSTTVESWDSLAHITLVLELESAYGVAFTVDETLMIKDFGSIKRVLASKGVRW